MCAIVSVFYIFWYTYRPYFFSSCGDAVSLRAKSQRKKRQLASFFVTFLQVLQQRSSLCICNCFYFVR